MISNDLRLPSRPSRLLLRSEWKLPSAGLYLRDDRPLRGVWDMSDAITEIQQRRRKWSARGGKCPICRRWFRTDECTHSVQEVDDWFERILIRTVALDVLDERDRGEQ